LAYYQRFLEIFPDIHSLAAASEDEVLKVWQGLGYYSRARNMHHTARQVVAERDGVFPTSYEEMIKLKGIGEYTASAVASIAFNLPHPVIDGNVLRFISRLQGILEPVNSARGKQMIQQVLNDEIDKDDPGLFNQALMEFGALVCTPKNPNCSNCIFQARCVARNTGNVDKIPIKEKKQAQKARYFNYLVIILNEDNQVFTFLKKRSEKDIWRNLYEFPMVEAEKLLDWDELRLRKEYQSLFTNQKPELLSFTEDFRHILSHQVLNARCFIFRSNYMKPSFYKVSINKMENYPVSRLMEKMMEQLNITFHTLKD
jgi:A/G-specific adenine glycosylase